MQLIDTSDTAVTQRAMTVMANKHTLHMQQHERRFGKLGELQTKGQKRSLHQALVRMGVKKMDGQS